MYNLDYKQDFINKFNKVFDTDNNVKNCGREACIQLILVSDKIESSIKHGNINTGQMNVISIIKLHDSIMTS